MSTNDPYALSESSVLEPPTSVWESLKYLGPGFILSASIVGSGELIATTLVGAKAGFVLMWFLIFSCLVKVAVQIEFGKHAISSGETTMASFNLLPGPRLGRANWSVWTWLLLMLVKMLQVGGIVGAWCWLRRIISLVSRVSLSRHRHVWDRVICVGFGISRLLFTDRAGLAGHDCCLYVVHVRFAYSAYSQPIWRLHPTSCSAG
ncbi:MAG: hypothetical protein R3C56_23145 [Pirellulaceae bacterium]